MRTLRLVAVGWWLQLKMRSRVRRSTASSASSTRCSSRRRSSACTGRAAASGASSAPRSGPASWASGRRSARPRARRCRASAGRARSSCWSRRRRRFPLLVVPMTLSMATIGLYSLIATLALGTGRVRHHISLAGPIVVRVRRGGHRDRRSALMGFLLAVVVGALPRRPGRSGTAFELPVWLICGFLVPLRRCPAGYARSRGCCRRPGASPRSAAAALGGSPWRGHRRCACVLALGLRRRRRARLAGRLVDSARAPRDAGAELRAAADPGSSSSAGWTELSRAVRLAEPVDPDPDVHRRADLPGAVLRVRRAQTPASARTRSS